MRGERQITDGDHSKADQADQQLTNTVDTDKDGGRLDKLGINVSDLSGGGLGSLAGNIGL